MGESAAHGERPEPLEPKPDRSGVVPTARFGPPGGAAGPKQLPPRGAPPAGLVIGRYPVEREIGRGGMGVVYLARDPQLDRPVALKVMHSDEPGALVRFHLEASALAHLSHPNAVRVYETGEDNGWAYLAMEYVEGPSLADALVTGPLDPLRAAALVGAIAGAVDAAHSAGVLHRDLKPANVLLDAAGSPKITDFGLAKRIGSARGPTQTNVTIGTPSYMAPEQADARPVDARTDVYGLGATLYECLTGRPPFVGTTPNVLAWVRSADPARPRRVNRAVPVDLETVCLKCLAKDPTARYPSASELADELGRVARGEPVRARPIGPARRAWLWCRRNRTVAALSALTALALVAGCAVAGWQAHRATVARDAEVAQRQEAEAERARARAAEETALGDKRRAEDAAAETAAINGFLLDDLLRQASSRAQADARLAPDPKLTVREALDRAAQSVGPRFRNRPAAEEGVRAALGATYLDLGAFDRARVQLRAAFELRTARLGPDHRDTLKLMNGLGRATHEDGSPGDAVRVLEECAHRARSALGRADRDALAVVSNLASAHRAAGAPARGLALAEECLALRRAALGATDPDTIRSMNNVAEHYRGAGRARDAVPLAEEGLALARRHLGAAHPDTLVAAVTLAMIYRETGRPAEMLALAEEALRVGRSDLGPGHPQTLAAMNALALAYQSAGRTREGLALTEESLRAHRRTLGARHPYTLTLLYNTAVAYLSAGRVADATPLLEDCLQRRREVSGPEHPDTVRAMCTLATAQRFAGRPFEARPLLEESVRVLGRAPGGDPAFARAMVNNLAVVYRETGRPADAVPLYRDLLRSARERNAPDHPEALAALSDLASALRESGNPGEALAMHEAVWRARSARAPAAPQTAEAEVLLGACLQQLDRFTDAEPRLLAGHKVLSAAKGAPAKLIALNRRALADLYDRWGRALDADRWRDPAPLAPPPRPSPRAPTKP